MTYTYQQRSWWDTGQLPRLGYPVHNSKRTELIIHHTVTIDSDPSPIIWETDVEIIQHMRKLQLSRPDLGLDIPYNFVAFIRPDLSITIVEGRGYYLSGAHTHGHNTSGLATSFAGNFEDNLIPGVALVCEGINDWLWSLRIQFPSAYALYGHRDFAQTACPGRYLYELKQYLEVDLTPIQAQQLDTLFHLFNDPQSDSPPAPNDTRRAIVITRHAINAATASAHTDGECDLILADTKKIKENLGIQ